MSVYGNAHAKDLERSILPSSCSLTSSTVARRRVHSRRYWWYSTLPVVVWLRSSQPERRLCCSLCPQNHIHLLLFCLFKLIPINHGFYASLPPHLRSSALSPTHGEKTKNGSLNSRVEIQFHVLMTSKMPSRRQSRQQ